MRIWMLVPLAAAIGCAHQKQSTATAESPPAARLSTEQASAAPSTAKRAEEPRATTKEQGTSSQQLALSDSAACQPLRVFFDFDSSKLSDENKAALDRAAGCLKNADHMQMVIVGNTDQKGSEEYNQALGERRAQAVADYLKTKGIEAAQLKTASYGKDRPICSGTSEDCDAHNRRAAIKICHM